MKSTRIVLIGAALGLLIALVAGLGRIVSSAGAMVDGMTADEKAGAMTSDAMGDQMRPDAMSGETVPDAMADETAGGAMADRDGPEAMSRTPAAASALSDAEIAMVAVVAGKVDISYAHLAMALSSNPDVRRFAETMIRDHGAVNEQAGALVSRLGVEPVQSDLSRNLQAEARGIIDELATLRGEDFDRRYAENELAYHEFVNTALREQFIPAVRNEEFREALKGALVLFEAHEKLARDLVERVFDR